MNKIKVLIVDDSVTIRAIFAEILKKDRGFELVGAAANAEEALDFIERTLPHVVALDLNMPGMDGIGFLDAMTELRHQPAVVVVSSLAHHDSPVCIETFEHGAIACFDKAGMIGNGPKLLALLKAAANGKISRSASRNENVTLPE